jgi:hypothetical protein
MKQENKEIDKKEVLRGFIKGLTNLNYTEKTIGEYTAILFEILYM